MRCRITLCAAVWLVAVSAGAQNLLVNPSFHSGLQGWSVSNADAKKFAAWSRLDHNYYGGSVLIGSLAESGLQTLATQCVNLPGDSSAFRLQGKVLIPSGQPKEGLAEYSLYWMAQPNCFDYIAGDAAIVFSTDVAKDEWLAIDHPVPRPANARSAFVQVGLIKNGAADSFLAYFDDLAFFVDGTGDDSLIGYVPGAGSLHGAQGANFKTSMQITNPGTVALGVRIVFHSAGPRNPMGFDAWLPVWLEAGKTVAFDDIVAEMGQSGLGTIDVYSRIGEPWPIVITRVYNDAGSAGTSGFTEPVCDFPGEDDYGEAMLVAPSDPARYRLNIGVRTFSAPVTANIEVYAADGTLVHELTSTFEANYYQQFAPGDFLGGYGLAANDRIVIWTDAPAMFYGALTDNVTNDPSVQFAMTR